MGGDGRREADVQPSPGLAGLMPRLNLVSLDARPGEQERAHQIVPEGVSDEVPEVEPVLRSGPDMPPERGTRLQPLID